MDFVQLRNISDQIAIGLPTAPRDRDFPGMSNDAHHHRFETRKFYRIVRPDGKQLSQSKIA